MIGMDRKMELTWKQRFNAMHICRFCLSSSTKLHSLFEDPPGPNNKLHLHILTSISVEVFPSDHLPRFICNSCKHFMKLFYEYKQVCRQADDSIMRHVQKGTPLKNIPYTLALNKVLQSDSRTLSGTRVQVSLEADDSNENVEDDVYNIKIESGSDLNAAQVTVIPSNQDGKNRQVKEQKGERFQCNHCERSFVKYANFLRHVENKHQQSCEQCGEKFDNQDDLIYHSAIHATQNLTCPLCMEIFDNVDEVTGHIKSHVNASEFMCDFCELVFMTNDKLEAHLVNTHKAELQQAKQDIGLDESSTENRGEEDDDDDDNDNGIRVKQVGDEMVVEINKPDSFMLNNSQDEEKGNNYSEDSEVDSNHPDMVTDVAVITKLPTPGSKPEPAHVVQNIKVQEKEAQQSASILKRAEIVKRKVLQKPIESAADRKQKPIVKPENVMSATNDKSLRLLEKELQELKRTNTRTEAVKTPAKPLESIRSRRPQLATSTPKPKPIEERKLVAKTPAVLEKKPPEKRVVTKENKEPKDTKIVNNEKESKEIDEEKEELDKDKKIKKEDLKETPKTAFKNGASEKEKADEVIRRSNRPSKIKDYAKLVRDKPQNEADDSEEDDDDEEYFEDKPLETRKRRSSQKATVKPTPIKQPAAANTSLVRKRGRPRKDEAAKEHTPAKIKKEEGDQNESSELDTSQPEKEIKTPTEDRNVTPDMPEIKPEPKPILMSPSGQTLKQVPMKSLPPGVKPLPLPPNARQVGTSEVCEMQIGKKVVKVQKIMMTKAEVEAMAKKGLLEFKDGTMVLKQGIKLPSTVDTATLKTTLIGDAVTNKDSPKKDAVPTRCDLEDTA